MLTHKGVLASPSIQQSCAARGGASRKGFRSKTFCGYYTTQNKFFVKFLFLTGILYPLCYNGSTKGRGGQIDSIEKSRISDCAAYLRSRDAVLRSMARRGRDRAEQGNTAVFGVCGNWITKMRRRKKAAYRSFSHAFVDCSKQEQRC